MRTQRNMAQMKEQNKTPEKELTEMEISNLSDAQFKTLVIRMLTELDEFGHRLDDKMKAMLRKTKETLYREPIVMGRKRTQINGADQKKETSNQKRMKKQEFKKMRRGLGTSRTS